jgi:hypothetical protein
MRQTTVLVGRSPLAYLIAQALDRSMGSSVEHQLIWLVPDTALARPHATSGDFGATFSVDQKLAHVRVVNTIVQGINLNQYVILPKKVLKYDRLLVDQAAWYTADDLGRIEKAVRQLVVGLQAKQNTNQEAVGQIRVDGQSAVSYQLALSIQSSLVATTLTRGRLVVAVDRPTDSVLAEYLTSQGLGFAKSEVSQSRISLRIAQATGPLITRKIRNLAVDSRGEARVDKTWRLRDHPEVTYVKQSDRQWHNLVKTDLGLADALAALVQNPTASRAISLPEKAFLLTGQHGLFVALDGVSNRPATRQLVRLREQRLTRRIFGG